MMRGGSVTREGTDAAARAARTLSPGCRLRKSKRAKDGSAMPQQHQDFPLFPPPPVSISPDEVAGSAIASTPSTPSTPSTRRAAEPPLPVFRELPPQDVLDSAALRDVELDVKIEIGRARMRIEDIVKLADGAVIELDRAAGDPVDIFVNDRLVARGEVVVLNEQFAVRLTEVVSPLLDQRSGVQA
jgi:flagellar motor switch protein FliN